MNDAKIEFHQNEPPVELMRISRDGVWVNPDVPVDEVARKVLAAVDSNVKVLMNVVWNSALEAAIAECDKEEYDGGWEASRCVERIMGLKK